ncbi:hypothetical protein [Flammeovirga kamogawensis]|uniref:ABC transporter permease n=1 Tax=Flammeovirga kamogawensis TaxID=373891 RepID=A0ABX8H435_9BACT|nr:hypothetical protein [Flammeovirga kamogawensis]MBB6461743.1 hypothetical protein [Flammeovirga kamogawensis]QWG10660.1 hypothetical protein KM029_25085 [Flammeovirga kamogawensis]TRX63764.1 hypothetical protein EO216_25465 [Flammeovirga kamogawensis]
MDNIFNAQRFKQYLSLEFTYQKQLIYYSISSVILFIGLGLFFIRFVNDEPITEDDLFGLFLVSYVILAIVVVNRSFLAFRTPNQLITYLTFPVSQFEKFLLEYISTVIVAAFFVPALILFAYMVEGEIHQLLNPNIGYTGLDFLTNVIKKGMVSHSESEAQVKNVVAFILCLLPLSLSNVIFTGNSFFKKLPLIKSIVFTGLYITFHVFLIYFIFEKMNVGDYVTNDHPLFFFNTAYSAAIFIAVYVVIANAVFICSSFLKLKEKEI